jgi:hypothetical protein
MRNYPYVVVISGFTSLGDSLMKSLDDLEIPNFSAERDLQPGENSSERLGAELDAADVVLVIPGPQRTSSEELELEAVKSRKSTDSELKVIPVLSSLEISPELPDWLKDVKPLFYDPNNSSQTIASVVNSLIPDIEAGPEETFAEVLAEAEGLALRLQSIVDQFRHSKILLIVSASVFAAGVVTVTLTARAEAAIPLSGFYQFLGLVVLVVGGFSLFYSILNWSSKYQKASLARRLIEKGMSVIDESKYFLQTQHEQMEASSPSPQANTTAQSRENYD